MSSRLSKKGFQLQVAGRRFGPATNRLIIRAEGGEVLDIMSAMRVGVATGLVSFGTAFAAVVALVVLTRQALMKISTAAKPAWDEELGQLLVDPRRSTP